MKGPVNLVHLVPLSGGAAIAIDKPILFLGRQPECDVVLLNSRKVSRKHCCIAQIDDHFVVRDLGSMNGVRVNGKVVHKEARLALGDEIMVGDIPFRLEVRAHDKRAAAKRAPDKRAPEKPAPSAPRGQPAAKSAPAKSAPKAPVAKPARRIDPKFLSQDLPVALPDEDVDFAIEETQRKLAPLPGAANPSAVTRRTDEDDVIHLDDIDIIEE